MDSRLKIVTQIPLAELWRPDGCVVGSRVGALSISEITDMLKGNSVEFVLADVGEGLQWIPSTDRFNFWKQEAKPHLAEPNSRLKLNAFPGAYCYLASLWEGDVVLLERYH